MSYGEMFANLFRRVEALEQFETEVRTTEKVEARQEQSRQWVVGIALTAINVLITGLNLWLSHR